MARRRLPWTKTLNAKLGGVALVLLAFTVALIVGNTFIFSDMRGDSREMYLFGAGATYDYRILFYAERLASNGEDPQVRLQSETALRRTIGAMDQRFRALLRGDPSLGVTAIDQPELRADLEQDAADWRTDRRPRLERFLAASPQVRAASMENLRESFVADARDFDQLALHDEEYLKSAVDHAYALQYVFLAAATLVLALVFMIVRSVSARARSLADTADRIASGEIDLPATVTGGDELAALGEAFNTMTGNLRRLIEAEREVVDKNEKNLWIITTLAGLGHAMTGNPSVRELSQRVISYLCQSLEAQVGAMYVADSGGGALRLTGTYAVSEGAGIPERWKVGEGLVGQAAAGKRRVVVKPMPDDPVRIRWGLGDAVPEGLVVLPLLHEDQVRGVLELGSLTGFGERELELLERGAANVGLAIMAAETRARVQQLLEESQAQAEELTSQQEELRSVNETLAEQTRALELQKESLEATGSVLRQKATELEQASRYKSEFLANMSHELRTPLNSSLILAKLLIDNREGNLTADQVKYAQSIYSAGNDLLTLINDILDLSKVEAGKVEVSVETVRIPRLLEGLVRRFEPLLADKSVELSVEVEPGCPETFETDGQRLRQILTNLLSNAVKFTERGAIRVRVSRSDARVLSFAVEDTGIGIPVEQHEAIFEAFRQADGTTNRKFGGTGLGLSICRELARLLRGDMGLRSAPGEGSTFTLRVPLRLETPAPSPVLFEPEPAVRESTPAPAGAVLSMPPRPAVEDDRHAITDPRRVVLVVEDDPAFAAILRDLARERGFQCVVAGSADEGLRLAREHRVAAILLDVGLPDRSGLTVLDVLKRDPATRHVPVHVVSVHDHRQLAREMGAVGYALKPVERQELVSAFRLLEDRLARTMRSVLVVEDDTVQREAVTKLLATDDVAIVPVASAAEALEELRRATFDCVVVDLMLPEVSGFELLDRMSEDESCSFPPVIVYTARTLSPAEEQRLRRCSRSIIIKGARSPERLLEEVTLFLHQVESKLPPDKQRMLERVRDRESLFDGRRILVVEDDVRNIFALTSMLEPRGMTVDVARNGKEALARIAERPPVDLVLTDIMMPEMDGLTAIRGDPQAPRRGEVAPDHRRDREGDARRPGAEPRRGGERLHRQADRCRQAPVAAPGVDAEMTDAEIQDDLPLLLEAIYRQYHYDFRSYAQASIGRGVARAMASLRLATIPELAERIAREPGTFSEMLRHLTVHVSDLFRDPSYYRTLRERVVPHLSTYPSLRLWVAGCGTGEEAYSLAILLAEEQLLERSLIYATDIDPESLAVAAGGVYALGRTQGFSKNYFEAGGRASLSEHYSASSSGVAFSRKLGEHILFSDHSLATDSVFAEVQLISCRNVLIYFEEDLRSRAIGLFREAMCPRGFLGLGSKETLAFSDHAAAFEPFAESERVYRLR